LDLGFRFLGSGFRVSGSGFRLSGCRGARLHWRSSKRRAERPLPPPPRGATQGGRRFLEERAVAEALAFSPVPFLGFGVEGLGMVVDHGAVLSAGGGWGGWG